jgi:hypothetical protein
MISTLGYGRKHGALRKAPRAEPAGREVSRLAKGGELRQRGKGHTSSRD